MYVPPVTTFSSTLTQALLKDSPIREIFGGQLYCSVHRHGTKESVVVEPFFSLQLDLQVRLTRIIITAVPIHPSSSPPHVHTHTLLPLCPPPPPPKKKKNCYVKSEEVRTVQQALDSLVTREVVNMSTGSEAEVSTLVSWKHTHHNQVLHTAVVVNILGGLLSHSQPAATCACIAAFGLVNCFNG